MIRDTITLPPVELIGNAPIAKAAREYQQLLHDLAAERSKLRGLEEQRAKAEEADREALATAIRKGKPDPGSKAIDAANSAILACNRRIDALERATAGALADLRAAGHEHGSAWRKALDHDLTAARADLAAKVEEVAQAHQRIAQTHALREWIATLDGTGRWAPAKFASHLPALRGRSGDPLPVEATLAALRELAQPPATVPQQPHPPLGQAWPATGAAA